MRQVAYLTTFLPNPLVINRVARKREAWCTCSKQLLSSAEKRDPGTFSTWGLNLSTITTDNNGLICKVALDKRWQ